MENKPTSLLIVPLGKALSGITHLGVVDRWPATANFAKRARYSALIAFSRQRDKYATKKITVLTSAIVVETLMGDGASFSRRCKRGRPLVIRE